MVKTTRFKEFVDDMFNEIKFLRLSIKFPANWDKSKCVYVSDNSLCYKMFFSELEYYLQFKPIDIGGFIEGYFCKVKTGSEVSLRYLTDLELHEIDPERFPRK